MSSNSCTSTSHTKTPSVKPSLLEKSMLHVMVDQATPRQQARHRRVLGSSVSADAWKPKEIASSSVARSEPSEHISEEGDRRLWFQTPVQGHDSSTSPRATRETLSASLPGTKLIESTNADVKLNAKATNLDQTVPYQEVSMPNPPPVREITIICGSDDRCDMEADGNVTEPTTDSTTTLHLYGVEDVGQPAGTYSSARNVQPFAKETHTLKKTNDCLCEARKQEKDDLKKELMACYKKNISLSKKRKQDAALIERLLQKLEERDLQIAALHAAALEQNNK